MTIDIIYFTDFKSDFERKDTHRFTVPSRYKNVLIDELKRNDVSMEEYDFVMVRNDINIMKHILKHRDTYGYKALYRFSTPKASIQLHCDKIDNKSTLFAPMTHHFKIINDTKIINQCDAFLPTSKSMQKAFRPNVHIKTILCPPAINPQMLYENKQHTEDEKRFFYAGTLDKTREFETVLDAFSKVKSTKWKLFISTRESDYIYAMIEKYPNIASQIEIHNAKSKEELLKLIALTDIGVALLPDIPIYNSSTPVKIFDYYASAVPCLMTHSLHNNTLFTNRHDAWFCDFNSEDISKKIAYLLTLSKEEVIQIGAVGQARLLSIKNYETLAQHIATQLEGLS
jgi:glycosyltransferase involved in cell wall biosynthesis